MNKLLELVNWIWIEAKQSPFPLVQDKLVPILYKARDTARLLLKPYLTVYQWRSKNETSPLTVSYAGLGLAAPFIQSLLFDQEPSVKAIKRVPIWRPAELADCGDADITIVEASPGVIRQLTGNHALTLPFHVGLKLDATGDWEEVKSRFHGNVKGHDLRLVRKYGYEYHVTHSEQDFEMFYHTMYLPTLTSRYGNLASPMPPQWAHQYLQHGVLFLVRREGKPVSGNLCCVHCDVVTLMLLGVVNADKQLMREGAQGAAWYAMVHWANALGYRYVDFGGCWPYIEGVFAYKRQWGSIANVSPHHKNKQIWIKIRHDTPAVRQFLSDNPCVTIDKKGDLRILILADDPDGVIAETEARWHKQYAMPGLSGFLVRAIEDLLDD